MREISGGGDKVDEKEMSPEEMNKMLEETFGKLLDSQGMAGASTAGPTAAGSGSGSLPQGGFQEQIRATMDKLKDSSDNVRSEVSDTANQDMLQQMMAQMGDMGDSEGFQNLLEGMMEQLMSKDVLYEPMKDLESKFPDYLKEHKDKLSPEEYDRYSKQHDYIKQIVAKFESPGFDEKSEEQGKEIVDLMQKVCHSIILWTFLIIRCKIAEHHHPKSWARQPKVLNSAKTASQNCHQALTSRTASSHRLHLIV